MSELKLNKDNSIIFQWQQKIKSANRNNIFCNCRNCDGEWVDSSFDTTYNNCGSLKTGLKTTEKPEYLSL